MRSRIVLAVVCVLGLAVPLEAQHPQYPNYRRNPSRQQQQQPMAMPVDFQGMIQAVAPAFLLISDNDGRPWKVGPAPGIKVHARGTATPEFLRAGLTVEFEGEIDEHGMLAKRVGQLSVVVVTRDEAGLFPPSADKPDKDKPGEKGDGGAAAGKEKEPEPQPAVQPEPPLKAGKPTKRSATAKNAPTTIAAGKYRIVGWLTSSRNGKLSVHAGARDTVPLELADDAKISVDLADWTVAHKGDRVSVRGFAMPLMPGRPGVAPNQPRLAQAQEVKIDLTEPLTGVKKKGTGKAEGKQRASKKDLPAPAEN
jgi:hypothetical protein